MGQMNRLPDWELRLAAFLDRERVGDFRWGRSDCATFACDGIKAMTGVDPMARLRGTYTENDGPRLARIVLEIAAGLGSPEVPKQQVRRGDFLLVRDPSTDLMSCGLSIGPTAAVKTMTGWAHLPMTFWIRGWRV